MKPCEELLLKLIRSSVLQTEEDFSEFSDFEDWGSLFALCNSHSVIGMVYDRIAGIFGERIPQKYSVWLKQNAFKAMSYQAVRSLAFEGMYNDLAEKGIRPVVLKGEVLRRLYPQPESRTSLDEDLLVSSKKYDSFAEVLSEMGFEEINQGEDDKHWVNKKYSLYFEIHLTPFSNEKSYEKWNEIFKGCFKRSIVNGNGIRSLSREDNLLFLILHAAKHFVYSGVGIKQLLDIALFMKAYQSEMDMDYVKTALKKTKTLSFAAEVTAFIKEYLYSDVYTFGKKAVDEAFTEDVLTSGSLGRADEERVHSANVTASAFKGKSKLRKILFPPKERLQLKYPFCKKVPLLLPAAWVMRLLSYLVHGKKRQSLKTGNERLKLIKKYGLINK